jgi:hypothetical protein
VADGGGARGCEIQGGTLVSRLQTTSGLTRLVVASRRGNGRPGWRVFRNRQWN